MVGAKVVVGANILSIHIALRHAAQSEELQEKIDRFDPSLFEGEPDPPAAPSVIDSLLEGVLPGTPGYLGSGGAGGALQQDYVSDILPEAGPDEEEEEEEAEQGYDLEADQVLPPELRD